MTKIYIIWTWDSMASNRGYWEIHMAALDKNVAEDYAHKLRVDNKNAFDVTVVEVKCLPN